jgi:hypothetical protein
LLEDCPALRRFIGLLVGGGLEVVEQIETRK